MLYRVRRYEGGCKDTVGDRHKAGASEVTDHVLKDLSHCEELFNKIMELLKGDLTSYVMAEILDTPDARETLIQKLLEDLWIDEVAHLVMKDVYA